MITPQAIKDQEFQIKFRGYDAIEVRAYLDLLADDFFELTEQNRVQAEEIETLLAEQESWHREKESLLAEIKETQENAEGIQNEIDKGYQHKDQEIAELKAQLAAVEEAHASLKQENEDSHVQIDRLQKQLDGDRGESSREQAELEKLRAKVELLEEQNKELKQEGLDFKTTILAAQKFADNLRQTTQEEAREMMEKAHAEVEAFRTSAESELARLPVEIEELKKTKAKVREEVKKILESYLHDLDRFGDKEEAVDEDLADLFQSIDIPEVAMDTADGESGLPADIDDGDNDNGL